MNQLEFHKLRYSFNQKRYIEASASLQAGEVLALQGPSGAGKSTLLKMLARLISPSSGRVFYWGQDWKNINPIEWRLKVHYLPQKPVIFDGSVKDNLCLPFRLRMVQQNKNYTDGDILHYLDLLGLPEEILAQDSRLLSGGEAARICLARALLIDPETLLLDEPAASLDDNNRVALMRLIKSWVNEKPHRAVIMVSHYQEDWQEMGQVKILNLVSGEMEDNGK